MQLAQNSKKPEDVLKTLVDLIEEIRIRRQTEAAECLHPELKTFSQRELTDVACPSYKNYLLGRTTRLPLRDMILQIADYLECTAAERDELLVCAGYLPESFVLRDDQYQAAVRRALMVMKLLPLPATVVGRYSEALYANEAVFAKNRIPLLDQWEPQHRTVISWFFDPRLAPHHCYSGARGQWEETARGAVELTYLTNKLHLHDQPFRRLIRNSRELPDFSRFWDDVVARPPSLDDGYGKLRMHTQFLDEPITELCYLLPITENFEVSIVVGIPADDAARHVYTLLGCQFGSMQWEAMLKDFSAF